MLTVRPMGTISEGNGITVNPGNDHIGKHVVAAPDITGEPEVAQKPGMTGNSDSVRFTAKESAQEN